MSAESLAIALNHSKATGSARLILIGIANHDGDGGAWPSGQKLAVYAGGIDERNVRRAVQTLVKLREIRVVKQGGGMATTPGHLRPNLYHFLLTCPPYCDGSRQHRDTRKNARYVPNYLETLGDEQWQFGIESDPGAPAPSPGGSALPRGAAAPPHPGAAAPPELNLKKAAINSPSALEPDAGARASSEVPSAEEWSSLIDRAHGGRGLIFDEVLPPCPSRIRVPCSYDRNGRCLDCGLTAEERVDFEQLASQLSKEATR